MFAGPCRFLYDSYGLFKQLFGHHNLNFYLRQEDRLIFGPSVCFGVAFLVSESLHIRYRGITQTLTTRDQRTSWKLLPPSAGGVAKKH